MKNKKWIIAAVIALVAIGGGYGAYQHFKAKPAAATTITAKVQKGTVRKVISATGTVKFAQPIPLSFPTAGKIVELNVKPGDQVKAGQVLAKLDSTSLEQSIVQGKANLANAEANLQRLYEQYTPESLAQAQSNLAKAEQALANAQQNLTTAKQNADPTYLSNQVYLAEQNVKLQSDALAKAQQSGNSSSIQQALSALNSAQNALTEAKRAQNGGAQQALAAAEAAYNSAQSDVEAAKAQVEAQKAGPKAGDIQAAEANVASAKAALAIAQDNLSKSILTAPVDGIITTVSVQNYETTAENKEIMTLAATNEQMEIDAAIDQADITQVKVGQKADITVDSQADKHVSGTVVRVSPQGTTTSNVTTFSVTVQLDEPTDILRAGMNANVNIIIAEAQNVLTIPSEAIRQNGGVKGVLVPGKEDNGNNSSGQRSSGQGRVSGSGGFGGNNSAAGNSGANRPSNLNLNAHFVPVTVGLDDGTNVEIKSGLTEGQEVIVSIEFPTTNTGGSSSSRSNSNMGSFRVPGINGGTGVRALGGGGNAGSNRH